jgi:hypothetical protein
MVGRARGGIKPSSVVSSISNSIGSFDITLEVLGSAKRFPDRRH